MIDGLIKAFAFIKNGNPTLVSDVEKLPVSVDNGTQGTGTDYNPPTGGSGSVGYLSAAKKLLVDIDTKLAGTLSVNVSNQIDSTTITSHLLAIKNSVSAIDTNTDTVEQKILDTITAINSSGTVNHTDLLSVITQLQAVNANTDTEEALLASVLAKIIAAPATEAKQDSMLGTQGTGSDYNQPTGGTGLLGYLSGVFKNTQPSATITNRSGTITTGGTAQVLMAANANRKSYWIQNQSTYSLWISRFGATATQASPSLEIKAGGYFETPLYACGLASVSIIGSVTGQIFTCGECV